jgi:hypothetical protein
MSPEGSGLRAPQRPNSRLESVFTQCSSLMRQAQVTWAKSGSPRLEPSITSFHGPPPRTALASLDLWRRAFVSRYCSRGPWQRAARPALTSRSSFPSPTRFNGFYLLECASSGEHCLLRVALCRNSRSRTTRTCPSFLFDVFRVPHRNFPSQINSRNALCVLRPNRSP